MINDIKMGFKILKYGFNFKTSITMSIIFMVLGIFLEMGGSTIIGSVYVPLIGIYFGQIAHSIVQSTMVQSSSNKKKLQTKIPALVMGIIMLGYNTIVVVSRILLTYMNPEQRTSYIEAMFWGGLMTLVIMAYFAFAMKYYWLATIGFFVIFYVLYFSSMLSISTSIVLENASFTMVLNYAGLGADISLGFGIVFSYVCILLGMLINYGISVLLYKKDYSKMNFQKALDRAK